MYTAQLDYWDWFTPVFEMGGLGREREQMIDVPLVLRA
jgi:hypothetical protein